MAAVSWTALVKSVKAPLTDQSGDLYGLIRQIHDEIEFPTLTSLTKGCVTGFEPAISRSTIWCLNR